MKLISRFTLAAAHAAALALSPGKGQAQAASGEWCTPPLPREWLLMGFVLVPPGYVVRDEGSFVRICIQTAAQGGRTQGPARGTPPGAAQPPAPPNRSAEPDPAELERQKENAMRNYRECQEERQRMLDSEHYSSGFGMNCQQWLDLYESLARQNRSR